MQTSNKHEFSHYILNIFILMTQISHGGKHEMLNNVQSTQTSI